MSTAQRSGWAGSVCWSAWSAWLSLAGLAGCDEAPSEAAADASSEPMPVRVGDIELLPGDPPPPRELSVDTLLRQLSFDVGSELCMWLLELHRPSMSNWEVDCPGHDVNRYFNLSWLNTACHTAAQRPACDATVGDVLRCAVAIDDCGTTAETPACRIFDATYECRVTAPGGAIATRTDSGP